MDAPQSARSREIPLLYSLMELPRAAAEAMGLVASQPLFNLLASGDGHTVMVLPGFMAGDESTLPLRRFIDARGYRAEAWGMGRNMGARQMGGYEQLLDRLEALFLARGPISMVGWSLGGVHARVIAKLAPEKIRQIISLGSPIGGSINRTAVWGLYQRLNGRSVDSAALDRFMAAIKEPPSGVASTAIFSRSDGVVPWQIARECRGERSENIEVFSSHLGLGVNPTVYYAIADRLAQHPDQWQAFDAGRLQGLLYGPLTGQF